MRLSAHQVKVIRDAVVERDATAEVVLFGSRVNDQAKGGDIDLLVLSDSLGFKDLWPLRSRILDQIGWQKLDILIEPKALEQRSGIGRIALQEGVTL